MTGLKRVLVANRGEIALRIVRACEAEGIESVAVYSSADAGAAHVREADQAIEIGPPPASESYLDVAAILSAAEKSGADAVHPGYGFLAENAGFAAACEAAKLVFIGPDSKSIRLMGDKSAARRAAAAADVPIVPGSEQSFDDAGEAEAAAEGIGLPLLLKARAGGGGRGMRIVERMADFTDAFVQARNEAEAAFGDGEIYLERFFERVHHVEVQIFGERDCSVQRRHQKLVEETPSPVISVATRDAMCDAARRLARNVGYINAGTVEFIYAPDQGDFYFIEMNTRIQVEHPVTEAVTGLDLIREQLRVAGGAPLSFAKEGAERSGHAIEFRLNAEDPGNDFRPSPGEILHWRPPVGPSVRLDSHIGAGDTIPPYYDSMIGKLIVTGTNRADAIERAREALGAFEIRGIDTTISFHLWLLQHPDFLAGTVDTKWVEGNLR